VAENGYQKRTRSVEGVLQRLGLHRRTLLKVAKRFGMVDVLAKVVPERIQQMVPTQQGFKRNQKMNAVELDETKAMASSQGPIYVNPDFDVEAVTEELIADLEAVEDEEGKLFTGVYRGDEVYHGPYVEKGPEVVVDQRPGVHVNDGMGGGEIQTLPDRWEAENTPHGIFLASGPDFQHNGQLSEMSILDIAPTLLVAHGCDVPTDMRGEVLDVFEEGRTWGERDPIDLGDGVGVRDDDEVAERLQQLGYME